MSHPELSLAQPGDREQGDRWGPRRLTRSRPKRTTSCPLRKQGETQGGPGKRQRILVVLENKMGKKKNHTLES